MQATKRYLVLLALVALTVAVVHWWPRPSPRPVKPKIRRSYAPPGATDMEAVSQRKPPTDSSGCRMESCFDFSRCPPGRLSVHIYPEDGIRVSDSYAKILAVIRSSVFFEPDPNKACVFVAAYDTLDRDLLSSEYQKQLPDSLPLEDGRNHIVFNLYSGTWPDYRELDFTGFNPGRAILAKASFSHLHYRPGFDISIPLFARNHAERGPTFTHHEITNMEASSGGRHLLVFKGKRYVYGIGSETRNSLHHLHNGRDIHIYTTCRHGKRWRDLRDERCDLDDRRYDSADYAQLMANATFCLVPRGRRLGSFRYLEALAAGCVPVVLSNGWILPFNDRIDWSQATLIADERLLTTLPDTLRNVSPLRVAQMRARALTLYDAYFSSVERIVLTTLTIIEERIQSHQARSTLLWNMGKPLGLTGAIFVDPVFSDDLSLFPGGRNVTGFTTVIHVSRPVATTGLAKVVKMVSKSHYVRKTLLLWALSTPVPSSISRMPMVTVQSRVWSVAGKLYPFPAIATDAVLALDPESTLTTEELDFAFGVWSVFPHRIVGFSARDHFFDEMHNRWSYTSRWTNSYSVILLDGAFYHRYFLHLYTRHVSWSSAVAVDIDDDSCADLRFAFLVSHVTREPPIKVTQRKRAAPDHGLQFDARQKCFTHLVNTFGYVPLVRSQVRLDPVLYKDAVSQLRKKYRKLELVA